MTAAELQEMFGLSRETWRRIAAERDMVKPIDPKYTGGVTKWSGQGFAQWLANTHPELAARVPALLKPTQRVTSHYLGGVYHDEHPQCFVGRWRIPSGILGIVYPCHHVFGTEQALELAGAAVSTVVVVDHGYDAFGPDLAAADRVRPELEYEPRWSEVAAHIGTQVPWWPSELRRASHLLQWQPGDEPVPVEVVTWPSWEPLYDMAYSESEGTPLRAACFTLGQRMRAQSISSALRELAELREDEDGDDDYSREKRRERACIVAPAVPDTSDRSLTEGASDEVLRTGLAELCRRPDDLAVECLEQVKMWSGSDDLPFGGAFSVVEGRTTRAGIEWIKRLQPCPPTAIHRVWGEGDQTVGTFVDPVTGSPVVAQKGKYMFHSPQEISYHSYAPRSLPPGSVLKELIIDDPVWVRTQDGILYPAPVMDAPGISWGYTGSGPGTLAVLVGRLLDNGAAHAVTYHMDSNAEPKLEAFFQVKHKAGKKVARRKLERIRTQGA